ncbi:NrtA/SsuA/CpmA family ABC transporter substrate-binding protein [Clostridium sp. BJN0001]|uniref:NrtA/SsuA/CpmA family ABC transporter substrate-binding protein n=1 Tax=Clostridium sp. BJN0001 TaxID=2930219 RepID=UPI001FD18B7F|nr:NrtA/SsuA/CpmA family ABC transporter substrate-binding protein [Clostridium sp. BJN0001]
MKLKIIKGLLIGISIVSLIGCSSTSNTNSKTTESIDYPKEINITYVKSPLNVPSIIQKKDNLFGKEFGKDNINVNFENITSGPEQTAALAAGEIDFLHALGGTSALIAASKGVDLKIINTYSRSPKGFMILTKDPSIKTAKDLKDKKVAGPKGTILHQVLIAALSKEGCTENDVKFMNMGIPEASSALESGSVDASLLAGPAALKEINNGATVVADGEGLVDGIIVTAVSTKFAEKYPELVERFKKVENETLDYINNNEDECLQKVSDEVGLTLDETKEMYKWYDFNIDITENDINSLNDTQKFLIDNKMQDSKIDINKIILNS